MPTDRHVDLRGKVAIVTGAARGIGKNIAVALADAGAHVWILDTDENQSIETVNAINSEGNRADFLKVDLSCSAETIAAVQKVIAAAGKVDILVNNARAGEKEHWEVETEENWILALSVMLIAPFMASREAIKDMAIRKSGVVVNICSLSGQFYSHEPFSYQASKAGLIHLTRCLAAVAGPSGIRVNGVSPGMIVQDEHQDRYNRDDNVKYREDVNAAHPLRRAGTSDEIANTVIYLCSDQSSYLTGQVLTVDGGLTIQDPVSLNIGKE